MKKNEHLLTISFLLFIVACGIVRIFKPYDNWEKIVLAATMTSALLIVADILYSIAKTYDAFVTDGFELLEIIKQETSMFSNENEFFLLETEKGENRENERQLEEGCKTLERYCQLGTARKKRFASMSSVAAIVAYFLFLSVLVFDNFYLIIQPFNSLITVFSFALVLFFQLIETHLSRRIEQEKEVRGRLQNSVRDLSLTKQKLEDTLVKLEEARGEENAD